MLEKASKEVIKGLTTKQLDLFNFDKNDFQDATYGDGKTSKYTFDVYEDDTVLNSFEIAKKGKHYDIEFCSVVKKSEPEQSANNAKALLNRYVRNPYIKKSCDFELIKESDEDFIIKSDCGMCKKVATTDISKVADLSRKAFNSLTNKLFNSVEGPMRNLSLTSIDAKEIKEFKQKYKTMTKAEKSLYKIEED
jgi:hypothetical protein